MRSKACWRKWRTATRSSRRNWRRKCEGLWTFVISSCTSQIKWNIIVPLPVAKHVCPSFRPISICSAVPSLIFVLSCGFICCVCDVVSLLAPVMWLAVDFWSLLWCGWSCVWSSAWRWVKSTRRTRERSVIASRNYLNRVRWALTIPTSKTVFNSRLQTLLGGNVFNFKSCLCNLRPRPWCALRAKWRRWRKRTQSCSFKSKSWMRNTVRGLCAIYTTYLWVGALAQACVQH